MIEDRVVNREGRIDTEVCNQSGFRGRDRIVGEPNIVDHHPTVCIDDGTGVHDGTAVVLKKTMRKRHMAMGIVVQYRSAGGMPVPLDDHMIEF